MNKLMLAIATIGCCAVSHTLMPRGGFGGGGGHFGGGGGHGGGGGYSRSSGYSSGRSYSSSHATPSHTMSHAQSTSAHGMHAGGTHASHAAISHGVGHTASKGHVYKSGWGHHGTFSGNRTWWGGHWWNRGGLGWAGWLGLWGIGFPWWSYWWYWGGPYGYYYDTNEDSYNVIDVSDEFEACWQPCFDECKAQGDQTEEACSRSCSQQCGTQEAPSTDSDETVEYEE